jgi:hypothetical protein
MPVANAERPDLVSITHRARFGAAPARELAAQIVAADEQLTDLK